ncbi:hypothetical protein WK65_30635 [Burkholderia ubonensis]|nr:hypothetical protein WK65_30635 [Burkholderia ubonensis]
MIDLRHPLAVLATRMPRAQIEASFAPLFAHRGRAGQATEAIDLSGWESKLAGAGVNAAGRPRLACDSTNLGRFRQALGEAGVEELLSTTIAVAANMKAVVPDGSSA